MREERSPGKDRRRRSTGSGVLRALIEPRFLSPFGLNDGGSVSGRRSYYLKLPPQDRIKLSVVKLDGSLFGTFIQFLETQNQVSLCDFFCFAYMNRQFVIPLIGRL